ncbi:esterase FE4-like [Homalodisca vitripennis]|uniref:esterase FE4-like n=1 Tax=Homalodisca vitripennis TaxID=197043 RepID=UPI001EE9C95A|nr:esterase FE4-like [Homalodisca vitripennis]
MVVWTLLQVLALCWVTSAVFPQPVMVRTAQGRLRGGEMETYTGKHFFAFRGVRYAEAPVGDYRFKPPVPVRPWGEEIREAVADGPVCPQASAQYFGPSSSEDCLFLNVYSKKLSSNAKHPVMVYLHAGGYAAVTGNSNVEGPQYLLEKDIVLVTINYRLGALGFVCTNDSILPGNYGMKDQVEALKWVKENILSFGGDPDRVTLFGYSAGGASVTLHMVSPLSKGLFHRAIAMSGTATSGWAINRDPLTLASRLTHNLDSTVETIEYSNILTGSLYLYILGLFHRAIAMSGTATSGWAINRDPLTLASRLTHNLGCPSSCPRLIYACFMKHSTVETIEYSNILTGSLYLYIVGLFHRAIAMSGTATSGWAINRDPLTLASRLTHNLGCPSSDSRLIYACLMKHSAEEIVNATRKIKDFEFTPIALFAPVVEEGPDAFLTADPFHLLQTGQFSEVPLILGVTKKEFAARGYYVLLNATLTEEFNDKFDTSAPVEFMYERKGEKSRAISAAIRKFYVNNQPISNRTRTRFMEIYTDSLITFSVVQTARLIAAKSSHPVYLYLFDYAGMYSHQYIPGTQKPLGVAHHDDLIYLFYISTLFPEFNATDTDAVMVRTLTSIWTNFATTGVPTVPCKTTAWQPLREGEDRYLRLGRCPEMVSGIFFPHRMDFWNAQFPLSGPHQQNY